jgi:hypothetical protein
LETVNEVLDFCSTISGDKNLPMGPQVFDGIEFGCVGRQKFPTGHRRLRCRRNRGSGGCDGLQTIPNDEEFAAGELAAEIFEEGDKFGSANCAIDELEAPLPFSSDPFKIK